MVGTNALAPNADIANVQEWLGHANIATTRLYDRRQSRPEEGSGQNDVHAQHRRALCAQTDGSNNARYRRRAYAYPKASG
jgi:hypothetical protein